MQIFTPTTWEIDSTSSFAPISFFLVLQGSELICNAFSRNFSICISYQQCQQLSTIPISLYPIGFFFWVPNTKPLFFWYRLSCEKPQNAGGILQFAWQVRWGTQSPCEDDNYGHYHEWSQMMAIVLPVPV